jgi:PPIC-type PPIASE domain
MRAGFATVWPPQASSSDSGAVPVRSRAPLTPRPPGRSLRRCAAAALLAACCGGCASSSAHDAIATVAGAPVTKTAFEHWLLVSAHTEQATASSEVQTTPPVPPKFTACIAADKRAARLRGGSAQGDDATARARCAQRYHELREAALGFLVHAAWIVAEASARHIRLSAAQVESGFARVHALQFPAPGAFSAYLRRSAQTVADLRYRVRVALLLQDIQRQVVQAASAPSPAAIAAYFRANRSSFLSPERRDAAVIRLASRQAAVRARALLARGASFASVAARYARPQDGEAPGGEVREVRRSAQPQALAQAIFSAPVGPLQGPLGTPQGFYVFAVRKVIPPAEQTLGEATPALREQLTASAQQRALSAFTASFEARWRARTVCQTGFEVARYCANA